VIRLLAAAVVLGIATLGADLAHTAYDATLVAHTVVLTPNS